MEFNSNWFKENLARHFSNYKLEYRYFPEGDFRSLDEVIFESEKIGGTIHYWGKGFLGISAFNYKEGKEVMNLLIDPQQLSEKEKAFESLQKLL